MMLPGDQWRCAMPVPRVQHHKSASYLRCRWISAYLWPLQAHTCFKKLHVLSHSCRTRRNAYRCSATSSSSTYNTAHRYIPDVFDHHLSITLVTPPCSACV